MEFSPFNPIVKLCLQGIALEEKGNSEEAGRIFLQAWNEATVDFEKFLAAYYVARNQNNITDKLEWYQTALQCASKVNEDSISSVFPNVYTHIAKCYEAVGDHDNAKKNDALAASHANKISDKGPFYHGTRADLQVGDFLTAGNRSNYQSELIMNHIYFTALINGAGLAASLAKGDGRERVYIVEPTGPFENDPNVTDKKFPGNLTRSYRTEAPLLIIGEVTDWVRQKQDEIEKWKDRLEKNQGEIIN